MQQQQQQQQQQQLLLMQQMQQQQQPLYHMDGLGLHSNAAFSRGMGAVVGSLGMGAVVGSLGMGPVVGSLGASGGDGGPMSSTPGGPHQFPRLYDGRIHVPLQLIQEHFAAAGAHTVDRSNFRRWSQGIFVGPKQNSTQRFLCSGRGGSGNGITATTSTVCAFFCGVNRSLFSQMLLALRLYS
jgi:hypothetical protein